MPIAYIDRGIKKFTYEKNLIYNYKNEKIDEISFVPGIALYKIIREQKKAYVDLKLDKLIKIIKDSSNIIYKNIDGESVEEYYEKFSYCTGLPIITAVEGLKTLTTYMKNIEKILSIELLSNKLDILDSELLNIGENYLSFTPYGKILGVIAPSNHPAIHISWITALVMKYSVVIKPGNDDPFTPYRLCRALNKAGLPDNTISYLPTFHNNVDKIIDMCDKSIFYGNDKTVKAIESNKLVKRGAGKSKIFIDSKNIIMDDDKYNVIVDSIIHHGGRRCTNASSIILNSYSEDIVLEIINRLNISVAEPIEEKSLLGCIKNRKKAYSINKFIESNLFLDRDLTANILNRPRLYESNGITYLLPTIIQCESKNSKLYNVEMPFPFVTIIYEEKNFEELLSNSLCVSLITEDKNILNNCLNNNSINKVIWNKQTYHSKIGDLHDGSLFQQLYKVKSITL